MEDLQIDGFTFKFDCFRELKDPLIPWEVILKMSEALANQTEGVEEHNTKQVIKGFLSVVFMNKYNR